MKKNNCIEIIFFVLFCIGTTIITCFHEPHFDEFQAWGISKDSIYNILFVIPHFEGHSPLWHLILKCFSHFNVYCEAGIKIPNLLFMFGAVWLLIFKSPFPRLVRLILPFTYFLFYQYSAVSRPYSIFCFAMFLAAVFYKERNEHPFKFVSALALLCLSSAYGMVISAGIIIVWFIELIQYADVKKDVIERAENPWQSAIYKFIKDKRLYAMFAIFLICIVLFFIIYPDKNVTYNSPIRGSNHIFKLLYVIFVLPSDALVTNFLNYSVDTSQINILYYLLGILINILIFSVFRFYKKLLLFYIPYLMLITVYFNLYFHVHHIGLVMLFFIFTYWCALDSSDKKLTGRLKKIVPVFILISFIIQLNWSVFAYLHEYTLQYSPSRQMAKFIKENNLDKYKIMIAWKGIEKIQYVGLDKDGKYNKFEIFENENITNEIFNIFNLQNTGVIINPYFNKNIFYSLNIVNPGKEYVIFKKIYPPEIFEIIEKLRQEGLPDICIGFLPLELIFDKQQSMEANYMVLKTFSFSNIWKNKLEKNRTIPLVIKKELYDKLFNKEKNTDNE